MPTSSDDKVAFVMRANPDQVAHLERLIQHTGQRQRTKAVWIAVERQPRHVRSLRRGAPRHRPAARRAADVLAEAGVALRPHDAVLAEIRSGARPHRERGSARTLRPRARTTDPR